MGGDFSIVHLFFNKNVFEFGQVIFNRTLEVDLAFFDKHHDRDAGEILCHGHDLKDGVLAHRFAILDICHAHCVMGHNTSMMRDEIGDTRHLLAIY